MRVCMFNLNLTKLQVSKLLNQIYACVQEKYEENVNQDLLDVFSPILVSVINYYCLFIYFNLKLIE